MCRRRFGHERRDQPPDRSRKTAQSGNAQAALAILDELAAKHQGTLESVVKNQAERANVCEK